MIKFIKHLHFGKDEDMDVDRSKFFGEQQTDGNKEAFVSSHTEKEEQIAQPKPHM